jgi:uracil-DNA glycosylase
MRLVRLLQHFDCIPKYLLIGEAPGYQGCHFSGIPFTNEKLLLEGRVPRVKVNLRITRREPPWSEPTATVMWKTLRDLGIDEETVMWNAFAWHPFRPDEPMSNRAPTDAELVKGIDVLRAVTSHFKGEQVIAVGRVAERALKRLGVAVNGSVRHPSYGGVTDFRNGMAALIEKRRCA